MNCHVKSLIITNLYYATMLINRYVKLGDRSDYSENAVILCLNMNVLYLQIHVNNDMKKQVRAINPHTRFQIPKNWAKRETICTKLGCDAMSGDTGKH